MILYDSEWAPSPRRVRIFLAEKDISVERRMIDLRAGEHRQPDFLRINPWGTVPVLQLPEGKAITDSVAICRYFEALAPEPALFGRSPIEIATIEQWSRRIDEEGYRSAVYALRNAAPAFANQAVPGVDVPVPQLPDLVERARVVIATLAKALDARLQESVWIGGEVLSFADIAALVAFDFADKARLSLPSGLDNLDRWRAAMNERPSAKV